MATAASRTTPSTRKSPAKPKVEDKPTFHFSIKQAEAEREEAAAGEPAVEPFTVEGKNGETITFRDPEVIGWQESAALTMRDPFLAVQTMLDDENYQVFVDQGDFGNGTLRALIQAWMGHHGVIPPGN